LLSSNVLFKGQNAPFTILADVPCENSLAELSTPPEKSKGEEREGLSLASMV